MKSYGLIWCVAICALAYFAFTVDDCEAQVAVQLPTFEQFSVSTTVVVPDRGSLYLGGVNRSNLGRSSLGQSQFGRGLPGLGNRSFGRSSAASGLSISATIIDHDEIDRALLAEAARRRGARFDVFGRPVAEAPRMPRDRVGQRWATGRNYQRSVTSMQRVPY